MRGNTGRPSICAQLSADGMELAEEIDEIGGDMRALSRYSVKVCDHRRDAQYALFTLDAFIIPVMCSTFTSMLFAERIHNKQVRPYSLYAVKTCIFELILMELTSLRVSLVSQWATPCTK